MSRLSFLAVIAILFSVSFGQLLPECSFRCRRKGLFCYTHCRVCCKGFRCEESVCLKVCWRGRCPSSKPNPPERCSLPRCVREGRCWKSCKTCVKNGKSKVKCESKCYRDSTCKSSSLRCVRRCERRGSCYKSCLICYRGFIQVSKDCRRRCYRNSDCTGTTPSRRCSSRSTCRKRLASCKAKCRRCTVYGKRVTKCSKQCYKGLFCWKRTNCTATCTYRRNGCYTWCRRCGKKLLCSKTCYSSSKCNL